LGDDRIPHPDGELAATSYEELRIDAQLVFEERSHPGRAGKVISDFAVTNADIGHGSRPGLIVFVLLRVGRVHPVLFVLFERRLELLVLAALVNGRPAFLFRSGEGKIPFRRCDARRCR